MWWSSTPAALGTDCYRELQKVAKGSEKGFTSSAPSLWSPHSPTPIFMITKSLSDMHSEQQFREVNCTLIASVCRGTYIITCDSEAWGQTTNSSAPSVPPELPHPHPAPLLLLPLTSHFNSCLPFWSTPSWCCLWPAMHLLSLSPDQTGIQGRGVGWVGLGGRTDFMV